MNKPTTTLFLLTSVDGKISTGDVNSRDFDIDLANIPSTATGLHQYYDIEKTTDLWSLNSGKVLAKVGINDKKETIYPTEMNYVVIDNSHLTEQGVRNLAKKSKRLFIVTYKMNHPADKVKNDFNNIHILHYTGILDVENLLHQLYEYGCRELTIQTGSFLNSVFLHCDIIDKLDIVVAPIVIGGINTPRHVWWPIS